MNTKKHNFATIIDCVREFHDAFGIANGDSPQGQLMKAPFACVID